ncbi:protein-export chaperone SecB [Vreelandella zhanjiangensis]|uniref:protein-export chaperone SecB n=1 Tax=Vreelandella zhanjiangensis TaxID=1121960 RepID=UPI00402AA65C
MKIQLVNTIVKQLSLSEDETAEEDDISFSILNGFTEEESYSFSVLFDLALTSEQGYKIVVSYEANFSTDEVVNANFKESGFPKINAPAIAYPYLRSFVSLVTLNSGYEPLILPTINFQAMVNTPIDDSSGQ